MGPVKFSSVMAMFWGIAGFTVGLIIASQLAWPALISTCRGRRSDLAAVAYFSGHIRLRGNV